MTVYIDTDFKCHTQPAEDRTAVETAFFDGKCDAYIEGFRYVPAGSRWTRADGQVFFGEMLAPWRELAQLTELQAQYAALSAELSDMEAALRLLEVEPTEEVTVYG